MTRLTERSLANFGSGPAALPMEVMLEASEAIMDYNGSGLSILEIPHRGKLFDGILEESNELVKELCGLGSDYEILWLQGGGRLQFCMIPMNFLSAGKTGGYIDSGHWASEAELSGRYYGKTKVLSSTKDTGYKSLPSWPSPLPADLAYLHFTTNNTIYGTQRREIPESSVPLIADMSSDILSGERKYTNCAMFYAVAQKNIGPAGATLVAVRKDLLAAINKELPAMLDYRQQAAKNSVLNTPPVFAIYVSMLVLRWTKQKGIETIEAESIDKSDTLYDEIERNSLFYSDVSREDRSRMNICFRGKDPGVESSFADFCLANKITGVKGHVTVGGFRVSLYNAVTIKDTARLITVMQDFEHSFNRS